MANILYQDESFIAVEKLPGLLCVPGKIASENLFDQVKAEFKNARVVHRLDMATSGLVLFALHYDAQRALSKLFEERKIKKKYSAIVAGKLHNDYGCIDLPMRCDWERRPKQMVDWVSGKRALTFFRSLGYCSTSQKTRVDLCPHTGRSHQLRVHMLSLGHPIDGDTLYHPDYSHEWQNKTPSTRMLLHAQELRFQHPFTKAAIHLSAEPDF